MTAKLLLILFFLPLLLAGCGDQHPKQPLTALGLSYVSEYDGSSRGDDNDVYADIAQPGGHASQFGYRMIPRANEKGDSGGSLIDCPAHSKEWEGTPWWVEITLYEEDRGSEMVSKNRWNVDCGEYWLHIAKDGTMTLHPGPSPAFPQGRRGAPALPVWLVAVGLLAALVRARH